MLYQEEFVAAVHASHPLADRQHLSWSDLAGHPLAQISTATSHCVILSERLTGIAYRRD